ncbi:MAG: CRTAC1 family protein [Planctomycetaceae bacterium]|nr:CRTAC1 family protein [Planctomycetaceae bacterium]MBT4013918.1 CRTAC1 family protein [Planctomycetaceae bacterium]
MKSFTSNLLRCCACCLLFVCGCDSDPAPKPDTIGNTPQPTTAVSLNLFTEVTHEVGLDFRHYNGMTGELYFPELMGSGTVLFDFDNDGDLDIYLVQGSLLGQNTTLEDSTYPPKSEPRDQLYRNDFKIDAAGKTTVKFVNVTEQSGIRALGYGMGVAVGDYNNDGYQDLYVTNWGENQLFQNNHDGTFTDVTKRAGVESPEWGTSTAFVDVNHDGWLDLYVCNYVTFGYDTHHRCYHPSGAVGYCGPQTETPVSDRLFINNQDGTFQDVSAQSGIARVSGPGLGVLCRDFNRDGWIDIYVANDAAANQLWINNQDGTFADEALLRGCACNADGLVEGSMGVDAADIDGDGDDDLIMGHWADETNTVFINLGDGNFEDQTKTFGLGIPSIGFTAFGTAWFDYDNDGWLDLFMANGATNFVEKQQRSGQQYPLQQANQLFHNKAGTRFEDMTEVAGTLCEGVEISRGTSFGDIDNDGDIDILVGNNTGPARLFLNNVGTENHWLGIQLTSQASIAPVVQCRIKIEQADQPVKWRVPRTDGSYLSVNDARVIVGLADCDKSATITVYWHDGRVERWSDIAVNQYLTLRQQAGEEVPNGP